MVPEAKLRVEPYPTELGRPLPMILSGDIVSDSITSVAGQGKVSMANILAKDGGEIVASGRSDFLGRYRLAVYPGQSEEIEVHVVAGGGMGNRGTERVEVA